MPRLPQPRSPILQRIHQAWVDADDQTEARLRKLAVDEQQFKDIIDGVRKPSSTDLALLSIAFQVSVDWLLSGEGPRYIGYIHGPDDPAAPAARDEDGKPLIPVGWYCWRCHNINRTACRSDGVQVYVSQEYEAEMTQEILRREEGEYE